MSLLTALSFALCAAAPLPPPEPPPLLSSNGQNWSVVGARTAGQSGNLIEGGLGYPGIHLSYLRGLSPNLDLGVRVAAVYMYEGAVQNVISGGNQIPGLKFQFLVHYKLFDRDQASVAIHFEPGPLLYFVPAGCFYDQFGNRVCPSNVISGFSFPVGLRLGIAASSALNVGISFDVPLWLNFGRVSTVQLPVLVGAGAEYFVRSSLLLYFNVKMGPTLFTDARPAVFTLEAKAGAGYRF